MKKLNEYVNALPPGLFAETPKSVFAAIAFSLAMRLNEDDKDAAVIAMCAEWATLHAAGIVPQKAPNAERIIFGSSARVQ